MSGRGIPPRLTAAAMCLLLCPYSPLLRAQAPPAPQAPAVPRPELHIVVLEGEGAVNDVRRRQGRDIVVQVRDGNRQPIAGAVVVFTLPEGGPSGEFAGGSKLATVVADQQGRALARIARPNTVPGQWEIAVSTSHQGETARVAVPQFNMAVERTRDADGGSRKWLVIVAVAGAAAAGGAVALGRGGNGGNGTAPGPPPVSISITPTTGTIGPPR